MFKISEKIRLKVNVGFLKQKRIRLTTKIEADFLLQFQSSMFWKKKKLSSLGNFLS